MILNKSFYTDLKNVLLLSILKIIVLLNIFGRIIFLRFVDEQVKKLKNIYFVIM